jgi:prephenate dehydrogenase
MNEPRIALVGLGAIGGSVALALLSRGIQPTAYTKSPDDMALAKAAGVRTCETVESAVAGADIVLLATPLDALPNAAQVAMAASPSATILHAGSLMLPGALGFTREVAARVVGTHPLAGTQLSGFTAARADMFRNAPVYVERRGTQRQRADAELLWGLAGAARIELVDAQTHDATMGYLSHAPQLVATAVAAALAQSPVVDVRAGPGLLGVTRLAASDYGMWRPILERAPEATLQALSEVIFALWQLRGALEAKDWGLMEELWSTASDWRRSQENHA